MASPDTLAPATAVIMPEHGFRSGGRAPPLNITAERLRNGRFVARNLVFPVPGLDLVRAAHPRYIREDRAEFAARDFDDTAWPVMDSTADIGFEPGKVHWVRFDLILPKEDPGDTLDDGLELSLFSQGAMEIYLNGKAVDHFGTLPPVGQERTYHPAPFVPRRTVRLHFARDGLPETIALRYVYEPVKDRDTGIVEPLKVALQLPAETRRMERVESATLLQYGVFLGINLIIMLLALVILALRPRDASWRRMSFFSFFMVLVAFTNTAPKVSANFSLALMEWMKYLNFIAYPFALLFLVLVIRSLFTKVTWRGMLFFAVITLVLVGSGFLTYHFPGMDGRYDGWLMLVFFFEVAVQSIRAVRAKVRGAWIVGIGAVLFIFNGVLLEQLYQFLGLVMPQELRTYMRFSLYLTMPITITVYLSVRSVLNARMLGRQRDDLDVEVMDRTADLHFEKERSEALLHNILPEAVAQELKSTGTAHAELLEQVTVLFTDFKDFTEISKQLGPKELVHAIHEYFSAFDGITGKYGIEKIKTIGDAYMAAGGLPLPNTTHAQDVVRAAFEMRDYVAAGKARKMAAGLPYFEVRIGIHSGPVVAGIVGVKKFQYDIWGDTVNTASRMESSGEVGLVNISSTTYAILKDVKEVKDGNEVPAFTFTPRGMVEAKGKEELEMYFVNNGG